jgi:probable phosphoglycerate mutase
MLARWAAGQRLTRLVSSPAGRAVQTAEPIAAAAGLSVEKDERLRELDFGSAEGLARDELQATYPDEMTRFEQDPVAYPLPGGEDPAAAAARAAEAVRDALDGAGERLLVVGHSTLFRLYLCRALGIPLADYRRRLRALDHDCYIEAIHSDHGLQVCRLNAPAVAEKEGA